MKRTLSITTFAIAALLAAACTTMSPAGPPRPATACWSATNGMTLYTFDAMRPVPARASATALREELASASPATAGPARQASVVITRDDGSKQWAYKGKPVYFWAKDQKPGDRTGDGVNGVWRLARP